uniref:Uncharacterized protein n=1 Tax=Arundo donax TaxID=35708 RepID=A0A0A9BI16_ARUDO
MHCVRLQIAHIL